MSKSNERIRVAIVDDHAMVRQALASVLHDDESLDVVAQGEDTAEAMRIVREERPDVLVLDYNMPGGGALPVLEEIARCGSRVAALVLTVHKSSHYATRVIESGAQGFMVKSAAVEELRDAIRVVNRGEVYITPNLSRDVIDQLRRPKPARVGIDALSVREFELLRIMGSGTGLKEAAQYMMVSVSTASTYRARIMKKLNLGSTSELIRFAIDNGLAD